MIDATPPPDSVYHLRFDTQLYEEFTYFAMTNKVPNTYNPNAEGHRAYELFDTLAGFRQTRFHLQNIPFNAYAIDNHTKFVKSDCKFKLAFPFIIHLQ
jgi:hypothetical protein